MTVEVKICGVRTPAILDAAVSAGADFVGLVFFPKSPRHLTMAEARALSAAARARVRTVAVMVDPDDALIDEVVSGARPDVLQLHGQETPARVAAIKARTGLPAIKSVPVAQAPDIAGAALYAGVADKILFDAKAPRGAALPGGNGALFDWQLLKPARPPFAVSGGLNPGNVADALRATGASLVDVSSGVETAPGEKDAGLVAQFIHAAKSASTSASTEHQKAS